MRTVLRLAVVLACVVATGVEAQQRMTLVASILDAEGQPPATISADALQVMEDGEAASVVNISLIKRGVRLQVLIDNGLGLQQDGLLHMRNGLNGLIKALPEGMETTLVTTAPQGRFLARATTNRESLLQAVGRLSPDSSPARFVEPLVEAVQRADREKSDFVHVIVIAATSAGERDPPKPADLSAIVQRFRQGGITAHVVVLNVGFASSTGGATQQEVGAAITSMTGGIYEHITAAGRLATLLPEIGAKIASSQVTLGNQFRITIDRPAGKRGDLGRLTVRPNGPFNVVSVAVEAK